MSLCPGPRYDDNVHEKDDELDGLEKTVSQLTERVEVRTLQFLVKTLYLSCKSQYIYSRFDSPLPLQVRILD